jgi:hypothetical protein
MCVVADLEAVPKEPSATMAVAENGLILPGVTAVSY